MTTLNEVFAMLEHDRQLTTSNVTGGTNTVTSSTTLPPNTLNGNNNNSSNNQDSATNVLVNVMAVTWLFVFMWFCCRGRPPGPEHWRGAEIRRRYQERLAREQARKERKHQSPEYRHQLVQHNMHTRTVITKDEQGNWTLGPVHYRGQDIANVSITTRSTADSHEDEEEEDDENEYSCVICLDPFHVGDVVSWSRFSDDCHHVFHAECIQPWLEGKRQDECPSCRNRLILHKPPGLNTEKEGNSGSDEDNQNADNGGGDGDIETGINNNTSDNSEQEQVEEEDELDKDDEEDSFFVIMHGLISRVAKRASYTLIGTKDSMDEKEPGLPAPSPFRRVVSYEPMRSSPATIRNRSRPNSFTRDQPCNGSSTSSMLMQTIQAAPSFESEDSTNGDGEEAIQETIPFRRVQSDIVGYTLSRQRHKVKSIGIQTNTTTTTSNLRLLAEAALGTTSDGNKDIIPNTPPPTTEGVDEMNSHSNTVDGPVLTASKDEPPTEAMETGCPQPLATSNHTSNDVTTQTDDEEMPSSSLSHL